MSSAMICRKCGATVQNCGGWLERVNEKGVPGIWECRPTCGSSLPQEQAVIDAILGAPEMSAQLLADELERTLTDETMPYDGTLMLSAVEVLQIVAALRAQGWRPIAEAPKDGTTILLGRHGMQIIGWWETEPGWAWKAGTPCWSGYMADDDFYSLYYEPDYFTHYRPLPAPPNERAK